MLNEELLEAFSNYRRNTGKTPDRLRMNPIYFRNLLEELDYPEWIIKKKEVEKKRNVFGVPVELTDVVEKFEM
ncbi:hypothetical protein [Bacillus cereus]|uniref:hypothetical protein n=1 Tax=Bacillus cereus TaxID=1396 RepID=UPI00095184DD|nr:hypothetical protein [Bacillus cereus]OLR27707.1 hypothetical protein BLD50_00180 [Bacillus cereus]